jgi:hypothetical protein
MFERNRIDNKPEAASVPVEIELQSGEQAKGKLKVPAGHTPIDALNGNGGFVEFEPYGGEPRFIAKSTIVSLRLVGVPRTPGLYARGGTGNDFDPHQVLDISTESTFDEIRQAYVQLTKVYHPDRFVGVAMPKEVNSYLEAMARRINLAFAALDGSHRAVKTIRAEQTQPIYTSQPR